MQSCKCALISTQNFKFLGFEHIKEIYANDFNFSYVYDAYEHHVF